MFRPQSRSMLVVASSSNGPKSPSVLYLRFALMCDRQVFLQVMKILFSTILSLFSTALSTDLTTRCSSLGSKRSIHIETHENISHVLLQTELERPGRKWLAAGAEESYDREAEETLSGFTSEPHFCHALSLHANHSCASLIYSTNESCIKWIKCFFFLCPMSQC